MRNIYLLPITVALISLTSSSVCATDDPIKQWRGTYSFSGSGGREAGGIAVFLEIILKISHQGDCKISREGYQVFDSLECTVKPKNSGIDVLFKSFPGGKMENEYGYVVYKRGELLFSLSENLRKKVLVTEWGSLKPEGYVKKNRGNYFKKIE